VAEAARVASVALAALERVAHAAGSGRRRLGVSVVAEPARVAAVALPTLEGVADARLAGSRVASASSSRVTSIWESNENTRYFESGVVMIENCYDVVL
jgi:hypothetical protein